jgi:deazaflavin-dependent oxidoreductase (nitroreductase family)
MMAKTFRLTVGRRFLNWLVRGLLRLGLAPKPTYLLTVAGRRTGALYSTPVTLVEEGGERWLVALYGTVGWVRNARDSGRVALSRGRQSEEVRIAELTPAEGAPVLKRYLERLPITRPYFAVGSEASLAAFVAESPHHPVFRLFGPVAA